MQINIFLKFVRLSIVALYGTEFVTVSVMTVNLFSIGLLTFSLLLVFFLLLNVLVACEGFDRTFGLKEFVKQKHHHLVMLKFLLVASSMAAIGIHQLAYPTSIEHVGAEIWVTLLIEVATYMLVLLKNHIEK